MGLGLVYNGLKLQPGQQILTTLHDYYATHESLRLAAERSGADFVLFGPVYFTPSKAAYGAPQGVSAIAQIVNNVSIPVYAIGGLTRADLPDAWRAGAHGVAMIRGSWR